jgi:hypothetical protein
MFTSVPPGGHWSGSLDGNIEASGYGELRIPFALSCQANPVCQSAPPSLPFLTFCRELQLHILSFCDSATLFQLMQVCSATRYDAQKLFWSDPDIWYLVKGTWFLSGGFAGYTYNAIDALAYMQQIEVDFGVQEPFPQVDGEESGVSMGCGKYSAQDRQQQIQDFWQVFQGRFPRAKHVILSASFALRTSACLPSGPRRIAEQRPTGIASYVSLLQAEAGHTRQLVRSLWRHTGGRSGKPTIWEIVSPNWTRRSVLPPPKRFCGPVGMYASLKYLSSRRLFLRLARRILLLQAVKDYYVQNRQSSFVCPSTECEMRFELPAQWPAHAVEVGHYTDIVPPSQCLKTIFARYDARLVQMKHQEEDTLELMRVAWGEEGSPQRRDAMHAFLYQLQHDPLHTQDEAPEDSSVWRNYREDMRMRLVPNN